MTKTIEISVKCPPDFDKKLWPAISNRMMTVLHDKHELIPNNEEHCNWDFDSFLTEREVKDIAVFIFGNDLPYTTNMVKEMVLIGDGDCPVCGSNNRTEIAGGFSAAQFEGDWAGFDVLGMKCHNCNFEDFR